MPLSYDKSSAGLGHRRVFAARTPFAAPTGRHAPCATMLRFGRRHTGRVDVAGAARVRLDAVSGSQSAEVEASMDPLETVEIGATGLRVTRLGFGGAAIGGFYSEVPEEAAVQTVIRAHEVGVRYFDTAPLYGRGKSEWFYGKALPTVARDEFVISTKVGRLLRPDQAEEGKDDGVYFNLPPLVPVYDFSRDGVLRSLEESLQRLNLDRVDIALIHDPDEGESAVKATFGEPAHYAKALGEAFPALAELRSQGVVGAIGLGMNQWQALARFARDGDFDCFLVAGRYTLLDHSALPELLPLCEQKGISVILGGPYNSGILASDLSPGAYYFYAEAGPEILAQARAIKAVCDRHAVPLKAAALQFGLGHAAVASTIPGARSAFEVEENLRMAEFDIPSALWEELRHEGLIPRDAPTPSGAAAS